MSPGVKKLSDTLTLLLVSVFLLPSASQRHFLKSANFDGWFRNRRREMTQKLEALHLEALCEEVRREDETSRRRLFSVVDVLVPLDAVGSV